MRTLIVQLPLGSPSPSVAYAHAWVQTDAQAPAVAQQWAVASLLPRPDRQTDVVVVVPALALSWHTLALPAGLNKQPARLKAALQGLLEERLLDEPDELHLALGPNWKQTPQPWVAACQRAWLSAHLLALEAAGLSVHRIVPEVAPTAGALRMLALSNADADADTGWLWCSQAERGVWGVPLRAISDPGQSLWATPEEREQADVQAEPAVVALTSACLGVPARLMAPGQHWLAALESGWDLAQFEFQANAQSRRMKSWQRALSHGWHARAWRPARWGLYVLLASQLVGLNVWAWNTRNDWQAQQQAWTTLLQDSFPKTRVVVDAPVQMAQEVARLRQSSGQLSAQDLEAMLDAVGQALPEGVVPPRQWRFQPGQLQWPDFKLSASQQTALRQNLAAKGYQLKTEAQTGTITVRGASQ